MATIKLKPLQNTRGKRNQPLGKDIIEVAEEDYKTVLAAITVREVNRQIKAGNDPTSFRVDGVTNKPILNIQRRADVFFLDVLIMVRALKDAYRLFINRGVKRTGKSISKTQIWASKGKTGKPRKLGSFSTLNASNLELDDILYVTGPLVAWTRRYQYYQQGKRRSRAFKYRRGKGKTKLGKRPLVKKSLHESVASTMKRKKEYSVLDFGSLWVNVGFNVNSGGKTFINRVPGVSIRTKKRTRNKLSGAFRNGR